ncbi:MAG TPA: TIM barrel protein, partial [Clostridia bacterium]|nr:TIM barrel protein [Clostridia bacterium]
MDKFILSAYADEASSSIDGQINALIRNNIKYIEVRFIDGKSVLDCDRKVIREAKKKLDDNNISVSAIGSYIGKIKITDDFLPHMEAMKRALDAADILQAKFLRMFSFFIEKGQHEKYRLQVLDRMDALLNLAGTTDIKCCHENEKEIYGDTLDRCLDLLRTFKGRLTGIFDPANFVQCGQRPGEIFPELYPYTEYMHIKDALMTDDSVVPSGQGDGD